MRIKLDNRHENALKDEDVYPVDTVVRIKETGLFAVIKDRSFLRDGKYFMHYLAEIEGRVGRYAVYHQDVELEVLPSGYNSAQKEVPDSMGN